MSREIAATDATHSAIIRFPGRNPYFGLFIARLPRDQVKAFQCVLAPESDGPQDPRAQAAIRLLAAAGR